MSPKRHAVGDLERRLGVWGADHREHRAEDLFLRDPHRWRPRGRRSSAARSSRGRARRLGSRSPPRTSRAPSDLPIADVLEHGVHLLSSTRWPDVRLRVQRRCRPPAMRRGPTSRSTNSFAIECVDDRAAGGRAALAGRSERPLQRALDRQIQIGIREHDDRVLAAHLALALDAARGRGLVEAGADVVRAGERDRL